MKSTKSLRFILGGSLAALLAMPSVQAADLTWDNGAATGNWNTTDANFGGLWTNGNTAVFGGTAGSTVTINTAGISATGVTFNVNNDIIAQSGGNNLTLSAGGIISTGVNLAATITAPIAGTSIAVDGGGTLNMQAVNTFTNNLIVGGTSAGNTVVIGSGGTVANGTGVRQLTIGGSTFGSNSVTISTPGSAGAPSYNVSGNGGQMNMGVSSSSNSLTVSNGAYVAQTTGGGTNTWSLGTNAGANSNSMTITGTGSTVNFGSNQYINIGGGGSSNKVEVSAGGFFRVSRLGAGVGTGDDNYLLVTGTGSEVRGSAGSNSFLDVGTTSGGTGNSIRVESGGTLNFGGTGTTRRWTVGLVAGSDNNYIQATGAGSAANLVHTGIPLAIGGNASGAGVMTDGGDGNHLDVYSGASLNMVNSGSNANIPTGSTAIVLLGTNSDFNLGNGTGISTATVGTTTNFASGVYLKNSDGRLNFDSGRLIAGVTGNLVTGAGKVDLVGDAYVSSASGFTNTISTEITGSGDFTKEGTGTLDLTFANTYTGDTIVAANGGILQMENAYLADTAAVRLFTGGQMNLNTTGATDTIAALYFDGVLQAGGTWGGTGSGATNINTTFFAPNSGKLYVAVIPEPAAALLGGLGMLTLLRRRRLA